MPATRIRRLILPSIAACFAGRNPTQTPVVRANGETMRIRSSQVSGSGNRWAISLTMDDDNGNRSLPSSHRRWWHVQIGNLAPAAATTLDIRVSNAGYSDRILPVWSPSSNGGVAFRGRRPGSAQRLAAVLRWPLAEVIEYTNKTSDNLGAELLLRWLDTTDVEYPTFGPGARDGGRCRMKGVRGTPICRAAPDHFVHGFQAGHALDSNAALRIGAGASRLRRLVPGNCLRVWFGGDLPSGAWRWWRSGWCSIDGDRAV